MIERIDGLEVGFEFEFKQMHWVKEILKTLNGMKVYHRIIKVKRDHDFNTKTKEKQVNQEM